MTPASERMMSIRIGLLLLCITLLVVELGAKEYECHAYEFDEGKNPTQKKNTMHTCTTESIDELVICNKPAYTTGYFFDSPPNIPTNLTYTNIDTCGPCKSDSTACTECNFEFCNKDVIRCFQSIHGAVKATECTRSEGAGPRYTKCRKTTFNDYSVNKKLNYGCGGCKHQENGGDKGKCEECEGSTTEGCNAPVIQGQDYKCNNYTWDGRFMRGLYTSTEILCKRLPGSNSTATCNMPGSQEKMDFYTMPFAYQLLCNFLPDPSPGMDNTVCDIPPAFEKNREGHSMPSGCGPCEEGKKNSGTCQDCEGDFCNQLFSTESGPEFRVQASDTLLLLLSIAYIFK
ncbi:uncharacterized protein LOC134822048 [Bolinopsis microptera]|uniref:uncharacterized protein LOC134822048 n=1 Tax=Bolinopsis microptera TaxID=2820187 RepID=UPI003078E6C2